MTSQSGNGHWHKAVNIGTAIAGRRAGSNSMGYRGRGQQRGQDAQGEQGQERGQGLERGPYPLPDTDTTAYALGRRRITTEGGNRMVGVYNNAQQGGPITGAFIYGGPLALDLGEILRYVMGGRDDEADEAVAGVPQPPAAADAPTTQLDPHAVLDNMPIDDLADYLLVRRAREQDARTRRGP